jgi:5-methylcytosine-specific restriction enzyme subunit McrC
VDEDVFIAESGKTRIPIRNLWLLLLYASKLYSDDHAQLSGVEEAPDELPQLLARVLADAVDHRVNSPLTPSFQRAEADLRRVRGRINVKRTVTKSMLSKGLVACSFDRLSVDTPRNRLAREALLGISRLVPDQQLRTRCRRLAYNLERMGVGTGTSGSQDPGIDSFNRNDKNDRRFVYAARLAKTLALPQYRTDDVPGPLRAPRLTAGQLRSLFEAAAGGLYKAALPAKNWNVRTGTHLSWPLSSASSGMALLLPGMKTDIMIENIVAQHRIIIDTKFTSILGSAHHGTERFKSAHLYQLYTYLRSQERAGNPMTLTSSGVLLYPSTGQNFSESMTVHGHALAFSTVDLTASPRAIRDAFLTAIPTGSGPGGHHQAPGSQGGR